MANSPGPSSSKTPKPENSAKKKKVRRGRRKSQKDSNGDLSSNFSSEIDEKALFIPNFVIEPVKEPTGTFYKQRDEALGHINLKSFVTGTLPSVFITKSACDSGNIAGLLAKIQRFSVSNGVSVPQVNHTVPVQEKSQKVAPKPEKKRRKEKEKKKKEVVLFPKYMSLEEVKTGLEKRELMKGFIRINPKNPKESYVGNEDVTKSDYIIGSVLDRNRALDGDEVILRLKCVMEENKKMMEVVYITQKVRLVHGAIDTDKN